MRRRDEERSGDDRGRRIARLPTPGGPVTSLTCIRGRFLRVQYHGSVTLRRPAMSQREVVILSGVRTAIGDYGGSLKDFPPSDLGAKSSARPSARAKDRSGRGRPDGARQRDPHEPKDMYISRVCAVNGGLPHESGAMTVNRLCGSGCRRSSRPRNTSCSANGLRDRRGRESMSRALYGSSSQRWGARAWATPR
jgi:acetyl-CoA C-acetyltransferase